MNEGVKELRKEGKQLKTGRRKEGRKEGRKEVRRRKERRKGRKRRGLLPSSVR